MRFQNFYFKISIIACSTWCSFILSMIICIFSISNSIFVFPFTSHLSLLILLRNYLLQKHFLKIPTTWLQPELSQELVPVLVLTVPIIYPFLQNFQKFKHKESPQSTRLWGFFVNSLFCFELSHWELKLTFA